MRRLALLLLCILLLSSFGAAKAQVSFYQYNHLFMDNTVFSIPALYYSVFEPLTLDTDLFLDQKIERGYLLEGEDYYFGIAFIEEKRLEIGASTLLFVEEYLHSTEHSQDRFPIGLQEQSQSLGAFLVGGELWSHERFNLGLQGGLKLLQGQKFVSRSYEGMVTYDFYAHHLVMDRISSYSQVPKGSQIVEDKMEARGYSFDFSLSFEPAKHFLIQLSGENIYSQIQWKDVFTIKGEYDSQNLKVDEKGFFFYIPIFKPGSSWEYETYYTSLTPEWDLSLEYRDIVELGVFHRHRAYPYFSLRFLARPVHVRAGLFGDLFSLALERKGLRAEVMMDSLSLGEATSIVGRIGWRRSF